MDKTVRILVVDDSAIVRTLIQLTLKQLGFEDVTESDDGYDAFEKIKTAFNEGKSFDVAFMDWNIPMIKGIDVVKKCKAHEDLKGVRFIMVSAEQDRENIMAALEAGVTDYIPKPFSRTELEYKLKRIMWPLKKPKAA